MTVTSNLLFDDAGVRPPRTVLLSGAGRVVGVCRRASTAPLSYVLNRSAAVFAAAWVANTVVDGNVVGGDSDKSITSAFGALGVKMGLIARHFEQRIMFVSWGVPSTPQNRKEDAILIR